MKLRSLLSFAFASSLVALTGCDSQTDPTYRGEPLATVQGTVNSGANAGSNLDGKLVILWSVLTKSDDTVVGVTAPVSGAFPASFSLPLYEPPPTAALNYSVADAVQGLGIGYILVVKSDTDVATLTLANLESVLLGTANDKMIAYVEQASTPGSDAARVAGPLGIGYHLLDVHYTTPAEADAVLACRDAQDATFESCAAGCNADAACEGACLAMNSADCGTTHDTLQEAAGGFTTSIAVTLGENKFPNWF
jgi:hypothetical protein